MPKQDKKMRVGVTTWELEAKDFVDPLERWRVVDLNTPEIEEDLKGMQDEALKLWSVMNEAGVHAVVFELPFKRINPEAFVLLGFALARAYHVIVITDYNGNNVFYNLPWVTTVPDKATALVALRELHDFRETIMAQDAKELTEGVTPISKEL